MNSKADDVAEQGSPFQRGSQCVGHDRALTHQSEQAHPGWHVENGDHIQGITDTPRRSRLPVSQQLSPKRTQFPIDVSIAAPHIAERCDELLGDEHADVLVQHPPSHFEGRRGIVVHEKRAGAADCSVRPWRRRCAHRARASGQGDARDRGCRRQRPHTDTSCGVNDRDCIEHPAMRTFARNASSRFRSTGARCGSSSDISIDRPGCTRGADGCEAAPSSRARGR